MRVSLWSLAALVSTTASAQNDQITEGYYYRCEVSRQLATGKITAVRAINDDKRTLYESDFASWNATQWKGVAITWKARPGPSIRLLDIQASAQIYVRSEERLPRYGFFTLHNGGIPGYDDLILPMRTVADKKATSVGLPLRVLLAYAGTNEKVQWSIFDIKEEYGRRKFYMGGSINIAELREASEAVNEVATLLDETAAVPEQNCQSTPIYYNPLGEI